MAETLVLELYSPLCQSSNLTQHIATAAAAANIHYPVATPTPHCRCSWSVPYSSWDRERCNPPRAEPDKLLLWIESSANTVSD